MHKINVAVLRGGPSREYDTSLLSGGTVLKHLSADKYQAHDIFISKDGTWHREGVERMPERALQHIDVVINALHGDYGEDGKVQRLLDALGIPYTGSDSTSSAIGMNKLLTKKTLAQHGIKTPYYTVVRGEDDLQEKFNYIFHHFYLPLVVKPATAEALHGLTVVKNFSQLTEAIQHALEYSDTVLVEEFINGKEAVCGVVDDFRGESLYSLLPIEINRPKNTEDHVGTFTDIEKQELQRLSKHIHQSLGFRHYSHYDFIVTPRRGIFVLEVNTHPELTVGSKLAKSLESIGSTLGHFLDHIIALALGKK